MSFEHLYRLSDDCGLFEHARFTEYRAEHGYCVDDVARGLLVAVREPEPDGQLSRLAEMYLDFVIDAQTADGRIHNRRGRDQAWQDEADVADCWGRALWGLGSAVARSTASADRALTAFDVSAPRRSPWLKSMAFAALGAAEVLSVRPDHAAAGALLRDAADLIAVPTFTTQVAGRVPAAGWLWPEPRLSYANAVLPDVLLAAGSLLGDPRDLADGLALLGWLLDVETAGDHLSVTPVGGWASGDPRPGFDQQPIEVAALADACARAFALTGDRRWSAAVASSAAWFLGENDAHTALYDPTSGGGCDGLEPGGRNDNQGAESTLAMLSTFQQAHRLERPAGGAAR